MTSYLSVFRQQLVASTSKPVPLTVDKRDNPLDLHALSLPPITINSESDSEQQQDAESEDDHNDDEHESPMFPARNSAQRQSSNLNSSLALPASTTTLPSLSSAATKARRMKAALQPGYSYLDWAKLKASGVDLRGGATQIRRITRAELAQHKARDDAWAAYQNKVYNITPYLKFHPGGVGEIMRSAGKDGTDLFMKTHAWISVDSMLDSCLIGILV